ncbi:MAG: hypothetical protein V4733_10760 [Verrucomicrobiota bacterium]
MSGKFRAVFACLLASTGVAISGDFIRVTEDATAARLQTAVTRYEKNGVTVDLVGAVHIADEAYYKALQERFTTYESLLFEMIGGEHLGRQYAADVEGEPAQPKEQDAEAKTFNGLRTIYESVANYLELSGQAEHINYAAANFVHADLTLAEFQEKMRARKESILSFALESAEHNHAQPNSLRLIRAVLAGSANHVKHELIRTLGAGDDQVSSIAGENVIISDRNVRCLEVLGREIAAGRKNLGIFYGAAHFPDMVKRLEALGFKRVKHEWVTAWDIPKRAVARKAS